MIVTELKVVELTPSDRSWNLGQLFWHLITVTVTLAEVKFNDRHWDSGYYTFSSDRFLVFSTDHSKAMLLLWIFFVIYVLCLSCFHVCSL